MEWRSYLFSFDKETLEYRRGKGNSKDVSLSCLATLPITFWCTARPAAEPAGNNLTLSLSSQLQVLKGACGLLLQVTSVCFFSCFPWLAPQLSILSWLLLSLPIQCIMFPLLLYLLFSQTSKTPLAAWLFIHPFFHPLVHLFTHYLSQESPSFWKERAQFLATPTGNSPSHPPPTPSQRKQPLLSPSFCDQELLSFFTS